jgi:hypothetical protein
VIGNERERRRYSAVMPPEAIPPRRNLRERARRRDAMSDLADGLERYLKSPEVAGDRVAWATWALSLAAGLDSGPAPDGSLWSIKVHIEFP